MPLTSQCRGSSLSLFLQAKASPKRAAVGIVPGHVLKERRRSILKTAGGCTAARHTGKRSRAETFDAERRKETVMFAFVSSCLVETEFAPLIKKDQFSP